MNIYVLITSLWPPPHLVNLDWVFVCLKQINKRDGVYLSTGSYHDHSTCIDHVSRNGQGDGHSALAAVGCVGVGTPCLYDLGTGQTGSWNCDHSCERIVSMALEWKHNAAVQLLLMEPRRQKANSGGGRRGVGGLTLLQHSSVCVDGLVHDCLSISSLGHLLALHANLLALQDQIKLCLKK